MNNRRLSNLYSKEHGWKEIEKPAITEAELTDNKEKDSMERNEEVKLAKNVSGKNAKAVMKSTLSQVVKFGAGAGVAATLIGCGIVWVGMKYFDIGYSLTFIIGGVSAIVGGIVFAIMRLPGAHLKRPSFVWNKKYWLFYVLAFLFGARKQIFITFGPWVLVRIFHQPAYIIAQLWMVAGVLGIFFNPMLGHIIDKFGERKVLVVDSIFVFLVCMGYGLSHLLASDGIALGLLYACYVTDHLLFGVNIERTTYLSKIVVKQEDIAPSLSLGISINHVVSMSVPALGGIMWMKFGHSSVFMGAAVVALLMLVFSSMVKIRQVSR